jgi:hypothetical protein
VNAIDGQYDHHREVRQQQGLVKEVPVIEALEGLVGFLQGLQVVPDAVLWCKGKERGRVQRKPVEQAGGGIQRGYQRCEQGVPPRPG